MQGIRDVAELNHLWHVDSILSCGAHVNERILGTLRAGAYRLGSSCLCVLHMNYTERDGSVKSDVSQKNVSHVQPADWWTGGQKPHPSAQNALGWALSSFETGARTRNLGWTTRLRRRCESPQLPRPPPHLNLDNIPLRS